MAAGRALGSSVPADRAIFWLGLVKPPHDLWPDDVAIIVHAVVLETGISAFDGFEKPARMAAVIDGLGEDRMRIGVAHAILPTSLADV